MLWETFGSIHPGLRNPFTAVLLDSSVAVSVFFVLSGEALSSAFFGHGRKHATLKLAIKRYPRLAIPVFATSLLIYAIVRTGLDFNWPASVIVGRQDWLGLAPSADVTLLSVIKYSFVSVFVAEFPHGLLDIFLWTMRMELAGSLVVFAIIAAWDFVPHPRWLLWAAYLVLALLPSASAGQLSCFLAGMIFADLRWQGVFQRVQSRLGDGVVGWMIAALALTDGILFAAHVHASSAWFAAALLLLVFCSGRATRMMVSPLSQWLGQVSFPLYLVQFPVLISFTSWSILASTGGGAVGHLGLVTCIIIASASVLLSLVAAAAFMPVETFTKAVCNSLARAVLSAGQARSR